MAIRPTKYKHRIKRTNEANVIGQIHLRMPISAGIPLKCSCSSFQRPRKKSLRRILYSIASSPFRVGMRNVFGECVKSTVWASVPVHISSVSGPVSLAVFGSQLCGPGHCPNEYTIFAHKPNGFYIKQSKALTFTPQACAHTHTCSHHWELSFANMKRIALKKETERERDERGGAREEWSCQNKMRNSALIPARTFAIQI